jgi:HAE1 family hydrophobic/amphiphilic exporter-1
VFLPLAFIPGVVGEFFLPFAQTVCVSLLASTFVALTAAPVLGSILLRRGTWRAPKNPPARTPGCGAFTRHC